MPLKSLVVIALRLYALYWSVSSLTALLFLEFGAYKSRTWLDLLVISSVPTLLLLVAMVLWLAASRISSLVTRGHDVQVGVGQLTKSDIYCLAFIWTGLYFALSSIAATIQTGYYFFAFDFALPADNNQKGQYLWPFLGHAFTLIAGLACVFGAKVWTHKIIRMENKSETPPAA